MQNVNKIDLSNDKNGRRKRRRQRNLFGYYILVIFLALSIGFSLSVTLLFNIKEIVISGTTQYDNIDIIRASGVITGDNLIRLDKTAAEQKILEQMLYIDKVEIKKKFPDKLYITLTPSEDEAYIECMGGYVIISHAWRILEVTTDKSKKDMIVIKGFDSVSNNVKDALTSTDPTKDNILKEILDQISKQELDKIIFVDMTDKYDIIINYDNRINIMIGNSNDMEYKLKYAYQILKETKELSKNKKGYLIYHDSLGYSYVTDDEYDRINNKTQIDPQKSVSESSVSGMDGETSSVNQSQGEQSVATVVPYSEISTAVIGNAMIPPVSATASTGTSNE